MISLGTGQEQQIVFDPLLDNQRQPNFHKRLERTSNPSTGKYENYIPPGGSSQPQFRQFLSTMTDQKDNNQQAGQSNNVVRSSDDLLSEYGLNFNSVSLSDTRPTLPHSTAYQPFHQNRNISAPTLPPRTVNTSFLHNTNPSLLPQSIISTLPINSPLSIPSGRHSVAQPLPSCRDILADLDPLRSGQDAAGHHGLPGRGQGAVVGLTNQLQPPSVPPRTKKQWTTFE